jgi:hypothetical protein
MGYADTYNMLNEKNWTGKLICQTEVLKTEDHIDMGVGPIVTDSRYASMTDSYEL